MYKYKIIILLLTFLQIVSAQQKKLNYHYKNKRPFQQLVYNNDELLYIEAAKYFNSNKNRLGKETQEAADIFNQIKNRFLKVITQYPNSKLVDDAQLAIAEAAKHLNDKNLYETELQKVIKNYPNKHISYLNFEHPDCNAVLPALQSSFVQTDAYAKLQLAMIYYSNTVINSVQDYNIAITRFNQVIQKFPYSYCSAIAQYFKAKSYENLSFSSAIDKNIVIDEYEKVFDLYRYYSQKYSELALVRIGDFAIKFLPARMNHFKNKLLKYYPADNYIAESRFELNGNSRWNKKKITLFFKRINSATTTEDSAVVNDVVTKFNSYVAPHVKIIFTSNKNIADIKIDFSTLQGNFTLLNTNDNSQTVKQITSARILLKNNQNKSKRREILLHEMGHAFGLGHSFNPKDNLYFSGNNKFEYSSRDIATLQKIYSPDNTDPFFLSQAHAPRIEPEEKIFMDLKAQDLDFDTPQFSIILKPDWLQIDRYTGKITGIPPLSAKGYHEFIIRITDTNNRKAEILWRFMVDTDPSVTNINEPIKEKNADKLYPNYPNPFNPDTNIKFLLSKNSVIKIIVFNSLGEIVKKEDWKIYPAGINFVKIDLSDKASGIYPYKLIIKNKTVLSSILIMIK